MDNRDDVLDTVETEEAKIARSFWEEAAKNGEIKHPEERVVFHLSDEEAEKCRFEVTDMTQRIVTCTIHTGEFTHGARLHPPHLWNLKDGKLYHRVFGRWVRWVHKANKNLIRLVEEAEVAEKN